MSQLLRAVFLTAWIGGLLVWLYAVGTIIVEDALHPETFARSVPSEGLLTLGALAFILSFSAMFVYLWIWGWLGDNPTNK